MLNLIKKDIIIQKKTLLIAFSYTILFSITFSSLPIGLGLYAVAPIVAAFTFITNAVNYDEKNNCEIVLNSLPLKRADIVISKYISTFVFVIIGFIYSILIGLIGNTTGFAIYNVSISLLDIALTLTSVCIFSSIFFPLYFKFGTIKMKVINTLLFVLIIFLPILGFYYANKNPNNILVRKIIYSINNTSSFTLTSLALIVGLIIFLISLIVSIRIYNNKEF